MERVGRYGLFHLDFIGFLLKGLAAFAFGDLIDMFGKGGLADPDHPWRYRLRDRIGEPRRRSALTH